MRLLTFRVMLAVLSVMFVAQGWAQVELPRGKGIWFYVLASAGNPARVAKGVKSAGFDYVLLKVHEGSRMYAPNIGYYDRFAREFHNQGIKVYAWGFNYAKPASVDGEGFPLGYKQEAVLINQVMDDPLFDGYVFDWELNAPTDDIRARVSYLVREVVKHRNTDENLRTKPIGWSTHGLYMKHRGLPAKEFIDAGIDFVQPQIYWTEWRMAPTEAVNASFSQWRAVIGKNSQTAIIPTGQTYIGHWGHGPSDGEATEFVKACLANHATAVDFWRYPQGKADRERMPNYDDVLKEVNMAMDTSNNPTGVQVEGPTFSFLWSVIHSPFTLWAWLTRAYVQGILIVVLAAIFYFLKEEEVNWDLVGKAALIAVLWPVITWLAALVAVCGSVFVIFLLIRKWLRSLRRQTA